MRQCENCGVTLPEHYARFCSSLCCAAWFCGNRKARAEKAEVAAAREGLTDAKEREESWRDVADDCITMLEGVGFGALRGQPNAIYGMTKAACAELAKARAAFSAQVKHTRAAEAEVERLRDALDRRLRDDVSSRSEDQA